MEIVFHDNIESSEWDDFCKNSDDAWFYHTSTWIDYTLNMLFDNEKTENLSFGAIDHNKMVSIVPLIKQEIHTVPEKYEFGFAGSINPFPAFLNSVGKKHREKLLKLIFSETERLAADHQIEYASFAISPLVPKMRKGYWLVNPIPQLGFSDTQVASRVIDLSESEEKLLAICRKGHKSDIKFAIKQDAYVRILDSSTITKNDFQNYCNVHLQAAGRKSRPNRTWEIMYEWIKKDLAVLTLYFTDKNTCIAAALSIVYKHSAYYGSACVLPHFRNARGVMHLILWETMKFLKGRAVRWYETGLQYTPNLYQDVPSEKEVNIAFFKRGFGGFDVPFYRGEKFYSHEYMEKTIKERIRRFRKWMV